MFSRVLRYTEIIPKKTAETSSREIRCSPVENVDGKQTAAKRQIGSGKKPREVPGKFQIPII